MLDSHLLFDYIITCLKTFINTFGGGRISLQKIQFAHIRQVFATP